MRYPRESIVCCFYPETWLITALDKSTQSGHYLVKVCHGKMFDFFFFLAKIFEYYVRLVLNYSFLLENGRTGL